MRALLPVLYLLSCGVLPWIIGGVRSIREWDWPSRLAVTVVLFFAPMLLLGAVGLVLGQPTLGIGPALLLVVFMATAFGASVRVGALQWHSLHAGNGNRMGWPSRLALVSVSAAGCVAAGLLLFDFPRGFEPRAYHLPLAINALRSASLAPWDLAYMHMYPANQSLLAAFLLAWLPERALSPVNLLTLALCVSAVFALSRRAGADRSAAMLVAAGICTIPVFGFSAFEFGADLGGAALLGFAAYLVLGDRVNRPFVPLLAGLVAGLAFGFKSLHLVPIGVLGLFVLCAPVCAEGRRTIQVNVVYAGLFALGVVLTAGVWWLRNYLAVGNPLYPVHIAPVFDWFGWSAAPDFNISDRASTQFEWVRSPAEWFVYPWVEWHFIDQHYKHSSGLGAFFAAAIMPALVVGVPECAATIRRWRLAPADAIFRASLMIIVATILISWWLLGDRQPRYFMGAIVLVAPFAAYFLTQLKSRARLVLELVWLGCVLLMLVLIGSKIGADIGGRLVKSHDVVRHEVLEYVPAVDGLPAGSMIVNCVERPWNYAMFGNRMSNTVVSFSVARAEFRDTVTNRWEFSVAGLRALNASHLYIGSKLNWIAEPGLRLVKLGQLDRNPYNGVPLPETYALYAIEFAQ